MAKAKKKKATTPIKESDSIIADIDVKVEVIDTPKPNPNKKRKYRLWSSEDSPSNMATVCGWDFPKVTKPYRKNVDGSYKKPMERWSQIGHVVELSDIEVQKIKDKLSESCDTDSLGYYVGKHINTVEHVKNDKNEIVKTIRDTKPLGPLGKWLHMEPEFGHVPDIATIEKENKKDRYLVRMAELAEEFVKAFEDNNLEYVAQLKDEKKALQEAINKL